MVMVSSLNTAVELANQKQREAMEMRSHTEMMGVPCQQQIRPMINFSDNMIRDARVDANGALETMNPYK